SETPGDVSDEFETLDSHWRIYRKRRDARLPDIRLPLSVQLPGQPMRPLLTGGRTLPGPQLLSVYDSLLGMVMPASVLVDENYQLMHPFGGAEKLLRLKPGRPSNNILDLIDERVKAPLLGALQHATKRRTAVRVNAISVDELDYQLVVEPLHEQHAA